MTQCFRIIFVLAIGLFSACGTLSPTGAPGEAEGGGPIRETAAGAVQRESMHEPAVVALLERAESSEKTGNLDTAAATIERALRISPHDARLWHRLAQVRLRQNRLRQAGDLAQKSNAYAGRNRAIRAQNWRIIHRVKTQMGDIHGAMEALNKAQELEN